MVGKRQKAVQQLTPSGGDSGLSMAPRSGRILLVDDDTVMIRLLSSILTAHYEVRFATNGEDGIRIAQEFDPHVILLDVDMPDISGFEVCRRLKLDASTVEIAVIFVTSYFETEHEVKGLELGAADFIVKPVTPAQVRARVRTQFRIRDLTDRMRAAAMVDGLTGIDNRRAFDERLEREWRRARRNGQPISLLIVDVDFFKLYNDRYGHPAGDDALRDVAKCLDGIVRRPSDMVARYGGEEFVALLPETPYDSALHIAERMRRAVEALAIQHADSPIHDRLSISVGVVGAMTSMTDRPDSLLDADDPVALVRIADDQLYAAKAAGRNGVRGRTTTMPEREQRAEPSP